MTIRCSGSTRRCRSTMTKPTCTSAARRIPNTRAMTNVDPKRCRKFNRRASGWLETRMRRAAEGTMKWVGTLYPTEGSAQEAGMSLEEYEDFVFGATFADKADPVGGVEEARRRCSRRRSTGSRARSTSR